MHPPATKSNMTLTHWPEKSRDLIHYDVNQWSKFEVYGVKCSPVKSCTRLDDTNVCKGIFLQRGGGHIYSSTPAQNVWPTIGLLHPVHGALDDLCRLLDVGYQQSETLILLLLWLRFRLVAILSFIRPKCIKQMTMESKSGKICSIPLPHTKGNLNTVNSAYHVSENYSESATLWKERTKFEHSPV